MSRRKAVFRLKKRSFITTQVIYLHNGKILDDF
jgi:hypothetical protein